MPFELRWVDGPVYGDASPTPTIRTMLSEHGRLYLQTGFDVANYFKTDRQPIVLARNAYNGIPLWRGDRVPAFANEGLVFSIQGNVVEVLDGSTGELLRTIETGGPVAALASVPNERGRLIVLHRNEAKPQPTAAFTECFDVATGEKLWKSEHGSDRYLVDPGRLYLCNDSEIVATKSQDGSRIWRQAVELPKEDVDPRPEMFRRQSTQNSGLQLRFVHGEALVAVHGRRLRVHSTKDGKELWTALRPAEVGIASEQRYLFPFPWKDRIGFYGTLHDPLTGAAVGKAPAVESNGCISPLATPHYTVRGWFFRDEKNVEPDSVPNFFRSMRSMCGDAPLVVANGMMYSGPIQCSCQGTARVEGFPAFGTASVPVQDEDFAAPRPVIVGGAAAADFGSIEGEAWPLYRHDATRSAGTKAVLPGEVKVLWKQSLSKLPDGPVASAWRARITPGLTAPTLAHGLVYVADSETHRILALSQADGKLKWSFRADARVDTPPTLHRGRCLFGCRDGWVYCLRADTGQLLWKSRAAPAEQNLVAHGQIESAWPVHGSVVVEGEAVLASAGRAWSVDGGLAFCAFSLRDGKTLWARKGGSKNDIPISDGTHNYVQGFPLTEKSPPPKNTQEKLSEVPFSAPGPKGRLLKGPRSGLHDATMLLFPTWPFFENGFDKWLINQSLFGPGYVVGDRQYRTLLVAWEGEQVYSHYLDALAGTRYTGPRLAAWQLPAAAGQKSTSIWTIDLPKDTRVHGVVVTGNALLVAGCEAVLTDKPEGFVRSYARETGKEQWSVDLPGQPGFEPMAVAGRLFVTTLEGEVVCIGR